jgi:DNA-binding MarR family transcriptional regulator
MSPSVPEPDRRETLEAIRAVVIAAEQYREALAHHFGMGRSEAQAIAELAATGGLGQTELAARVGITTGAGTALIDRLEAAGLVQRTPHPTDRRRTVVTLTDRGHQLVAEGRESLARLFDGLQEQNLSLVASALGTIRQNLEREIQRL